MLDVERQCYSPSPFISANYVEVFIKGFLMGLFFGILLNVYFTFVIIMKIDIKENIFCCC